MDIRPFEAGDTAAVWALIEPVMRAGETYPLPRDIDRTGAMAYWLAPGNSVFVAVDETTGAMLGSYYIKANQRGGGAHVCNCGYITSVDARGRGVASAMCGHSLDQGRAMGFRAMQFNFVISTNEGAVRLWRKHGFAIVGTLPGVFEHPQRGDVDAFVMHQWLVPPDRPATGG